MRATVFFSSVMIFFTLISCVSTEQKALEYDMLRNFYMDGGISPEKHCAIYEKESVTILSVDHVDRPTRAYRMGVCIIPPGRHILVLYWSNGVYTAGPASMRFEFEEGKDYYLDYVESGNAIEYIFTEITDPEKIEQARMQKNALQSYHD
jgi:hypothetical protein